MIAQAGYRDALDWLLADDGDCPYQPSVTYLALTRLLDRPESDPDVRTARAAINGSPLVAGMLDRMRPDGTWMEGEHGWVPMYNSAPWRLPMLGELRCDPADPRIRTAVERALAVQVADGSFPYSGKSMRGSIICFDGHLLRALLQFGYEDDPRVQRGIDAVAKLTMGWTCRYNDRLPCAWGDEKALAAFAELSPGRRTAPTVSAAIEAAADRILARDLAVADYPYNKRVSQQWFRFTFRRDFRGDILETLLALAGTGYAGDPRLAHAVDLVASKAGADGRWRMEAAVRGDLPVAFDGTGRPSKWVTVLGVGVGGGGGGGGTAR